MEVIKRFGDKVFALDVSASVAGADRRRHDHTYAPKSFAPMRGLLGVICRHRQGSNRCPLQPREPTFQSMRKMSGLGQTRTSLDDLIGRKKQLGWHCNSKFLSGLEIDHRLKRGGLFYRQLGGLLAFKDPCCIKAHSAIDAG